MLIGHFAVAFAAKKVSPRISLGTFFLATLFLDLICILFLLIGIEHIQYAPGNTAVTPLEFTFFPFSHSLFAAISWAIMFAFIHFKLKSNFKNAFLLGLIVLSHWLLDALSHGPDLTLYPGCSLRLGLGLWNSIPFTLSFEGSIFIFAFWSYIKMTHPKNSGGKFGLWSLGIMLVGSYLAVVFGLSAPTPNLLAFAESASLFTVGFAYWLDRPADSN